MGPWFFLLRASAHLLGRPRMLPWRGGSVPSGGGDKGGGGDAAVPAAPPFWAVLTQDTSLGLGLQ